jgi:predicted permease
MHVLEDLRRDLFLAVRGLARRPTFTATVVATLALGIGANTAVFSVVDAVLLRPLPYPAPERLYAIWAELPKQGRLDAHLSGPELAAIWDGASAFEAMGAVWSRPGVLRGDGLPAEEVEVGWITPGFLEALGARAALGRLPTRAELTADPSEVIVLSHELWRSRFAADTAILGRTIDFDDERRVVVGVLPAGFRLHLPADQGVPEELAAFLPWGGDANAYREMPRAFRVFSPVARLAPPATAARAATELSAVAERARAESADYASSGLGLRGEPLAAGVVSPVRPTLLILLGVATLLLVVACANVANLALVRAKDAERELRVRAALGASRARLLRLLLAENLVLGVAGAALGLLLAGMGLDVLRALEPGRLPRLADVALHPRVLAYAAGLTLLTSLFFGGLSAAAAVASALSASLQDPERMATGRSGRLRPALVMGQLAVSLVLATGALLLVRSFAALQAVDPGFDPRGVLTARLSLPDVHYRYRDQGPKIASFYERLEERLRALPGVRAVGATTAPPLSGAAIRSRPYAWRASEGETEWGGTAADYSTVTPGWFEAAGVRRLAGRVFTDADQVDQPLAVVVDDALARGAWGSVAGAVGQPIRVEVFRNASFQPRWGEVVGVVGTVRLNRLEAAGRAQVYLAHAQAPQRTMYPTLRTAGDPYALLPAIQREVAALEKDLPVFEARLASEHVATATSISRFALATLGTFAAVALLLAAAGVYAVMAHSVGRRRYEIGVRLALGATPRRINALVLGQGMGVAALGIGGGILGALAATRVLSGLLFGVAPRDTATLTAAALLTGAAAFLACCAPAWRASRISPRDALDQG